YLRRQRRLQCGAARANVPRMTQSRHDWHGDLAELLRFYADAGHDEALEEAPVDRFAEAAAQRRPQGERQSPAPPERPAPAGREMRQPAASGAPATAPGAAAAVPDGQQAAAARELARQAGSLEELRAILSAYDGCNLKFTAKNLVFADGNPE